jgi:hypothetical protein
MNEEIEQSWHDWPLDGLFPEVLKLVESQPGGVSVVVQVKIRGLAQEAVKAGRRLQET